MSTPVELTVGTHVDPIWRGDAWAGIFRFKGHGDWDGQYDWKSQLARANNAPAVATCTITVEVRTVATDDGDRDDLVVTAQLAGATTAGLDRSSYVQDLQAQPLDDDGEPVGDPITWFRWEPQVDGQVTT